jgi:flagellar hook-associated protein 1 FlgK
MGNIMGMFQTGVSGLMASQAGIDVSGHNISNVNTAGYSRQILSLSTQTPQVTGTGVYGRGVEITSITRVYDEILAEGLRNENSELTYYETIQSNLSQVEIYFNELEDGSGLEESMTAYFSAWEDLANNPADSASEATVKRTTLVETTITLTQQIRTSYDSLQELQNKSDDKIESYVDEINQICENIAELNKQISQIEAVGNSANDYRDLRDDLLSQLSNLADVTVDEKSNSQVSVYLGGNTLVDDSVYNKLFTETDPENGGHTKILWGLEGNQKGDIDITGQISGGKIGAELYCRDDLLSGYMEQLDTLAVTLINETNKIHSLGMGLETFTQITSTNKVDNPSFVFAEEAGSFDNVDITNGTFRITVYDEDGNTVGNYDIDVDPTKDNLNSIVAKISAADGDLSGGAIQASKSTNNTIKIYTEPGYTFSFTEDTSNFLVAAGLNGYFSGSGAEDIALSQIIQDNSSYISTGASGAEGDNTIAAKIADLKYTDVFQEQNITIDEFYSYFVGEIASEKNKIDTFVTTKTYTVSEMELKLEEIQGVSMDEELTNLIKYQRCYEASARFITTVDEMLDKLINGVGLVGR